jgi:hypothetical protein
MIISWRSFLQPMALLVSAQAPRPIASEPNSGKALHAVPRPRLWVRFELRPGSCQAQSRLLGSQCSQILLIIRSPWSSIPLPRDPGPIFSLPSNPCAGHRREDNLNTPIALRATPQAIRIAPSERNPKIACYQKVESLPLYR